MFGKRDQFATVSGFGVRVKDEREKDRNHIIEINFEVPLSHDLADQILPAMARDLFQEVKKEWVPKPEMDSAAFSLGTSLQVMTVRQHPDLEAMFQTEGVGIRKVQARKTEGNTWILVFTTSWTMTDNVQAISMIRSLKSGVYLTFVEQAPSLDFQGDEPPAAGAVATVAPDGNVTNIKDGKPKKRRKVTPEDEAAAQVEEAQGKDDEGDEAPKTH
jgi:hypothetical protein